MLQLENIAPNRLFLRLRKFKWKNDLKRSDKNSKTSAVAEFASTVDDAILHPAGVELRSEKEQMI